MATDGHLKHQREVPSNGQPDPDDLDMEGSSQTVIAKPDARAASSSSSSANDNDTSRGGRITKKASRGRARSGPTSKNKLPVVKTEPTQNGSTVGHGKKPGSASTKTKQGKGRAIEATDTVMEASEDGSPAAAVTGATKEKEAAVAVAGAVAGKEAKAALTEEQKRANHILSEQKRRNAIRLAYDDLCAIVPALRAAIQEYEERLSKVYSLNPSTGTPNGGHALPVAVTKSGTPVSPPADRGLGGVKAEEGEDESMSLENDPTGPGGTVAGVLTGGIEVGGEKIDGRAGPKSEAVVLAKTVEYMRQLLDDREASLARLAEVQQELADSGFTVEDQVQPDAPQSPWNVKWRRQTASTSA